MYVNRIANLRQRMKEENIGLYYIPNTDAHQSEYVGESDRIIEYLTGFTGSNATLIVGMEHAYLWTDGRYFVQAQKELDSNLITLVKMGIEGEPTVYEFLKLNIKKDMIFAFDGKLVNEELHNRFKRICNLKKAKIRIDKDLISEDFENRPQRTANEIWFYDREYSGKTAAFKIRRIRRTLKNKSVKGTVITDLTQIAWCLNLRGSDIKNVPVFYAYLYISLTKIVLFIQEGAISQDVISKLNDALNEEIIIKEYDSVYDEIGSIVSGSVMVDYCMVNARIVYEISKEAKVKHVSGPVPELKAIKNKTEIENTRRAHIKDSVAVTRFIYELKSFIRQGIETPINEMDAVEELLALRREGEGFIGPSFDTIAAYGPNAAMMHYSPDSKNSATIEYEGFLLIDSGGHYLEGTTDTTRTIAVGKLTKKQKYMYTLCLKGHLALMGAKFPDGVSGQNLDILAREPFWQEGLDYRSGTGHGVGHLLSVHEGPRSIRWKYEKGVEPVAIKPGMVVTDEPGYYEEGQFGIRIENELLCTPCEETEYGKYYCFTPMTYVPYEVEAILANMLSPKEKHILNKYNRMVRRMIFKYLDPKERRWLLSVTRPVI